MVFRSRMEWNRLVTELKNTLLWTHKVLLLWHHKKTGKFMAGFHFFLFVVGLGAAITVVVSIADFSLDAYDTGVGDFFTYFVALIDIAYTLGIGGLAIYTN